MSLPEPLARDLRRRLADAQRDARLPSLSAVVTRSGEPELRAAFGAPEPAGDLQFRIGSITKTFTAVLVLQLRDEGRLRLDDQVGEHVPETAVGDLLIRDLLSHVSGLRREPEGAFWEAAPGRPAHELLDAVRPDDKVLPSRRAWHYSNVAYGLLGLVVERRRSLPYADALRQRILDPLGLDDTSYLPRAPFATGLRVHPFADAVVPEPAVDTRAMAPAGQLWSTPGDLCRWGTFLADPVEEVLAPATVDEMCAPVVLDDPETWAGGAGLGLQLFRCGERVLVGHGGSMPGFVAGLAVARRAQVAAAVCANAWQGIDAAGLACDLVTGVLDGDPVLPEPWAPTRIPPGLEQLLGIWWWRGVQVVAYAADGALHLGRAPAPRGPGAVRYQPHPTEPDAFVAVSGWDQGECLRVQRDLDGGITCLDAATFLLTRDPDDPRGGP